MRKMFVIYTLLWCSCSSPDTATEKTTKDTVTIQKEQQRFQSTVNRNCLHNDIAHDFDIHAHFVRYIGAEVFGDSCIIDIEVLDKSNHTPLDSIHIQSGYYFDDVLLDCSNVLSYTTKKNMEREIVDNMYGDIVIGDFNFDNTEDIAVIKDSGGNGGPLYNFYIQGSSGLFHLDTFLSDSMTYFPAEMNSKNKSLITYVHAGACWLSERIFELNRTNNWSIKSHRLIDICDEE